MANKNNKYDQNAPGSFYVDRECIACDACILVAENHFKLYDGERESFVAVFKQPVTPEEIESCQEALESCPVAAIGDDGESDAS